MTDATPHHTVTARVPTDAEIRAWVEATLRNASAAIGPSVLLKALDYLDLLLARLDAAREASAAQASILRSEVLEARTVARHERADGAAEERARIVAWLRYGVLHAVCTGTASPIEVIRTVLIRLADAIERGAHLEPKP